MPCSASRRKLDIATRLSTTGAGGRGSAGSKLWSDRCCARTGRRAGRARRTAARTRRGVRRGWRDRVSPAPDSSLRAVVISRSVGLCKIGLERETYSDRAEAQAAPGRSLAGLVAPLDVAAQFVGPEIHRAQIARGVALAPGRRSAARRGRRSRRPRSPPRPRPAGRTRRPRRSCCRCCRNSSLVFGIGVRAERGERAPLRRGEGDRQAGLRVVEMRGDTVVEPLEAVDLAPRHPPAAEVARSAGRPPAQRGQLGGGRDAGQRYSRAR